MTLLTRTLLADRNSLSHMYDGAAARRLVQDILERYIPAFCEMRGAIQDRYAEQLPEL